MSNLVKVKDLTWYLKLELLGAIASVCLHPYSKGNGNYVIDAITKLMGKYISNLSGRS